MNKYILYLDESGGSSLTDYKSNNFLITGVMTNSAEDIEISAYFNFIKRKYELSDDHSFHSYDLFENKKSAFYLTNKKARILTQSLSEFIDIAPFKFIVLTLSKYKLRKFFKFKKDSFKGGAEKKKDKEISYDILASKLFFWFGNNLEKESAKGEIIVESRRKSDVILLDTYLNCQMPSSFIDDKIVKLSRKSQKNITGIRFENKKGLCGGLEVADLISYISFLSVNKRIKGFQSRGIPALWKIIKKNMLRRAIQEIKEDKFKKYLTAGRVRRISNS